MFALISLLCIVDYRHDHPVTTPNQLFQEESNLGDYSGQLFSIYSGAAQEEDYKTVEQWQRDADGVLIFVSPRVRICLYLRMNWNTIERSILCRSRDPPCRYRPGPETKQPLYFRILPRQHLPGARRPERDTPIRSFRSTPILSFEKCHLGEYSLVLELGNESELCFVGDIVTSMGSSISPSRSACPVQSRKESTNACILCRGR